MILGRCTRCDCETAPSGDRGHISRGSGRYFHAPDVHTIGPSRLLHSLPPAQLPPPQTLAWSRAKGLRGLIEVCPEQTRASVGCCPLDGSSWRPRSSPCQTGRARADGRSRAVGSVFGPCGARSTGSCSRCLGGASNGRRRSSKSRRTCRNPRCVRRNHSVRILRPPLPCLRNRRVRASPAWQT